MKNPIKEHRDSSYALAKSLKKNDIYEWLLDYGYFPENYVVPPCFQVKKRPNSPRRFYLVNQSGKQYQPLRTESVKVHFPKTELTDRTFGIIHPEIHNDIAYDLTRNWKKILSCLFHKDNAVVSYGFPLPVDKRKPGRLGYLRAGRMIYEFIEMTDDDLSSLAYQYTHIVKADIKNFYPSIYTHSIPWAIHGKKYIRNPKNMRSYNFFGNRLDKLFQNANDGCTNGIPIGPVVSDLIAEIVASGVDKLFTKELRAKLIDCQAVRFKDDYRILVKSETDARNVIKSLQASLKEYNLELSDEKTSISVLPNGLFREWVSKYYLVNPTKKNEYSWKEFRELYLSVLRIDKECPSTGVIDRFLSDITNKDGRLKVSFTASNIQKVISMLLMLGNLRIKAFPKIIAILEAMIKTQFTKSHTKETLEYLKSYLSKLSADEETNKYLISWISYFIVSNGYEKKLQFKAKYKDPITRSVAGNRGLIFKKARDFKLFEGCKKRAKKITMTEYLEIFNYEE